METINATVETVGEMRFIKIGAGDEEIKISMSEDKPNEVKSAFNKLIARIRNGKYQIKLDNVGDDLFSQVANEYITQLNREILEVFGEMERLGLVTTDCG
jgi:hypothetical protein